MGATSVRGNRSHVQPFNVNDYRLGFFIATTARHINAFIITHESEDEAAFSRCIFLIFSASSDPFAL